jgi:hypothetical protein
LLARGRRCRRPFPGRAGLGRRRARPDGGDPCQPQAATATSHGAKRNEQDKPLQNLQWWSAAAGEAGGGHFLDPHGDDQRASVGLEMDYRHRWNTRFYRNAAPGERAGFGENTAWEVRGGPVRALARLPACACGSHCARPLPAAAAPLPAALASPLIRQPLRDSVNPSLF